MQIAVATLIVAVGELVICGTLRFLAHQQVLVKIHHHVGLYIVCIHIEILRMHVYTLT